MTVLTTAVLEIEYTDEGAGTPVVLVHEWPDAALALPYQPRGAFRIPDSFAEARLFWYQWLMYVDAAAASIAADRIGFAREQWDTWSPSGWYTEADFAAAAESFGNPDRVAITLNGYRTRFLDSEPVDARYDHLRHQMAATDHLSVPTLMLHGAVDSCDPPVTSDGLDGHFDDYRRVLIDGAGHFPHREAPAVVLRELIAHRAEHG